MDHIFIKLIIGTANVVTNVLEVQTTIALFGFYSKSLKQVKVITSILSGDKGYAAVIPLPIKWSRKRAASAADNDDSSSASVASVR